MKDKWTYFKREWPEFDQIVEVRCSKNGKEYMKLIKWDE